MRTWQSIERQRQKHLRKGASKGMRIFSDIMKDVSKQWANYTSIYDFENTRINRTDIQHSVTKLLNEIYVDTGVEFAKQSYRQLKSDLNELNLKQSDIYNLETKGLQLKDDQMLINVWSANLLEFVRTRCGDKIQSITQLLYESIQKITKKVISEAALNGWGADKVAREIRKNYNDMAKWEALRIARTEVVGASNEGACKGADSLGIELNKIWLSALKETTRAWHADLNETEVGQNEPFDVDGDLMMYPGDPSGRADNVINCLCAVTHRIKDSLISELLGE